MRTFKHEEQWHCKCDGSVLNKEETLKKVALQLFNAGVIIFEGGEYKMNKGVNIASLREENI